MHASRARVTNDRGANGCGDAYPRAGRERHAVTGRKHSATDGITDAHANAG
jgi:hypothetical protein